MDFGSASQLIIVSLKELFFALLLGISNSEAVIVLLVFFNSSNRVFTLLVLLGHGYLWLAIDVVSLERVSISRPLFDDP